MRRALLAGLAGAALLLGWAWYKEWASEPEWVRALDAARRDGETPGAHWLLMTADLEGDGLEVGEPSLYRYLGRPPSASWLASEGGGDGFGSLLG